MTDWHIRFIPRNLSIGVVIGDRNPDAEGWWRTIYVCPVPCVVVSFDVRCGADPS